MSGDILIVWDYLFGIKCLEFVKILILKLLDDIMLKSVLDGMIKLEDVCVIVEMFKM